MIPHTPPKGYSYEVEQFKPNIQAIWIVSSQFFSYKNGEPARSIWGFYSSKKKCYYAPVNYKTVGKVVSLKDTTPYSAMPIRHTPLTAAFV